MSRRRFFVPPERIRDGVASLPPDQTHHLRNVLRLTGGDEVEVFDGSGVTYLGTVDIQGPETRIKALRRLSAVERPRINVTLAPALFKADRFEWMLQKATELGVDEIIPIESRFSEIRIPPDKLGARLERWRRIIQEAAKQCRRTTIPWIVKPAPFADLLITGQPWAAGKLLFSEKASLPWDGVLAPSERVLICTGPEGGWESNELEAAGNAGFGIYSLGPRTLRAETAAIAALVIVQFITFARSGERG